jgi:hypothetical protein
VNCHHIKKAHGHKGCFDLLLTLAHKVGVHQCPSNKIHSFSDCPTGWHKEHKVEMREARKISKVLVPKSGMLVVYFVILTFISAVDFIGFIL